MADSFARLHTFLYAAWQREGVHDLTQGRIALLETADALLKTLHSADGVASQTRHILLGSQSVLLEDVLHMRPHLLALLVIYGAGGRLSLSPFYVGADAALSGGETLVRDLLMGLAEGQAQGFVAPRTVYLAHNTQYNAQLPQILRGFGLDNAIVTLQSGKMPLPFRWASPDESDILVFPHDITRVPEEALEAQSLVQPDGPFLWVRPFEPEEGDWLDFPDTLLVPTHASTPAEFVAQLRESLPDNLRPLFKGDFYTMEQECETGRFSARIPFKQRLDELTTRLTRLVEPLLTVAFGDAKQALPENAHALLAHSWRLLLQNHAPAIIGGMALDEVISGAEIRLQQVTTLQEKLLKTAVHTLYPAPATSGALDTVHLVVWNAHSRATVGMVDVTLRLPEGKFPQELRDKNGESVVFTWYEAKSALNFRAQCPSLGYTTYTLELSSEPTSVYHRAERSRTTNISDEDKVSLALDGDHLVWQGEDWRVEDLVTYYNSGDDGSTTVYRTPVSDAMLIATLTDQAYSETAPTYERLVMTHRLRVPNGLENGRRGRGFKAFDITTTATLYFNVAGLHLHTAFTNPACDHRLRLHLQTSSPIKRLLMDSAYYLNARPTGYAHPLQTFAVAQTDNMDMLLTARGIREMTTIAPNTLALTLLRAVGWLDENRQYATPAAQTQETLQFHYALYPKVGNAPAQWWHTAQAFQTPLHAIQLSGTPATPERSYLSVEDERVLVTALKPPQAGAGWVVRLFNPHDTALQARLHAYQPIARAQWLNLQEAPTADAQLSAGAADITLKPYQIATLLLQF